MAEIDETCKPTFLSAPPWWMPMLIGSATPLASRGHAFLLISDDGDEATLLGSFLAAKHLCQRLDMLPHVVNALAVGGFLQQTHGDFLRVSRQEGKTTIGIEQIRDATRFVQQTPLYGHSKVLQLRLPSA